jgi:hypothetical protein
VRLLDCFVAVLLAVARAWARYVGATSEAIGTFNTYTNPVSS